MLGYVGNAFVILGVLLFIGGLVGKAMKRLDNRSYRAVWRTALVLVMIGVLANAPSAIQGWKDGHRGGTSEGQR